MGHFGNRRFRKKPITKADPKARSPWTKIHIHEKTVVKALNSMNGRSMMYLTLNSRLKPGDVITQLGEIGQAGQKSIAKIQSPSFSAFLIARGAFLRP